MSTNETPTKYCGICGSLALPVTGCIIDCNPTKLKTQLIALRTQVTDITEEKEIWRKLAGKRALALEKLGGMEAFTSSFAPRKLTREWIELEARIDFARSTLAPQESDNENNSN